MVQRSSCLHKAIFFIPLAILILERISGLASYQQYYLSSMESLELSSFVAPFVDSSATSYSNSLWKDTNDLEHEAQRLRKIEREDERRVANDEVDYKTELEIKSAAGDSALDDASSLQRRSPERRIPLDDLTGSSLKHECDKHFRAVEDKPLPYEATFSGNRRIPRIIHQTSRSRCLTTRVYSVVEGWDLGDDWARYFHDDEAMDRLFQQDWPEFPHLRMLLKCIDSSGTLKADIWRYLVLWEYGGIYADVDTKPKKLDGTTITAEDDGFFTVEQYHLLSQYFMATSPRHRKFHHASRCCPLPIVTHLATLSTHLLHYPFRSC
jgi:hypothetical protein